MFFVSETVVYIVSIQKSKTPQAAYAFGFSFALSSLLATFLSFFMLHSYSIFFTSPLSTDCSGQSFRLSCHALTVFCLLSFRPLPSFASCCSQEANRHISLLPARPVCPAADCQLRFCFICCFCLLSGSSAALPLLSVLWPKMRRSLRRATVRL